MGSFNPRSPRRERPRPGMRQPGRGRFNPRSPRRERRPYKSGPYRPSHVSIHAPREGSDDALWHNSHVAWVSIHAPREGSDQHPGKLSDKAYVSIHAPREGSDLAGRQGHRARRRFNPRSPRRERPLSPALAEPLSVFQSTLPAKGATCLDCSAGVLDLVSIHAPREGSDIPLRRLSTVPTCFNPRSPRRERRSCVTGC